MSKKYNLLIPLAGKGNRMLEGGYTFPKPMIMVGNKAILDYGLDSIDYSNCNLIFVVRKDHVCNFSIDVWLKNKYGNDIQIVITEKDTKGSVSSCLLAKKFINNNTPLIVFCPDVYFEPVFVPTNNLFENEGHILTFKSNSSNYSYVCLNKDGFVDHTAEKIVISENASVGVYCFKNGKSFVNISELAQREGLDTKNEFYICPLYNLLVAAGGKITTESVDTMYIMGTPEELEFFEKVIFPYFLDRSFILCSDHSGFDLKEKAKSYLEKNNLTFLDCGCFSSNDCDYSDYIDQAVKSKKYFPGALILGFCRSANGVNICANKKDNIRAAIVSTEDSARLAILHNAANFLSIPTGTVLETELRKIISVLQKEKFQGGRHQNRLQKIEYYG